MTSLMRAGGRTPPITQMGMSCIIPNFMFFERQAIKLPLRFLLCARIHHHRQFAKMSWMDSWSRPSKSQATPPPLYLLPGGEATPYCRSCGRVISEFSERPCIFVRLLRVSAF